MLRIRLAAPDAAVTPAFIEGAMEAVTRANEELHRQGLAPTASSLIQRGAKWKPEPYGDGEHFDLVSTIAERGWGDCDDWAPALAAEYRVTGLDPGARAIVRRSGDRRWHALTQLSDGSIVDPSQWAGMPSRQLARAKQLFSVGQAGAMISPAGRRGWFARCDLPVGAGHLVGVGAECCSPARALAQAVGAVCAGHERGAEVAGRVGEWLVGFDLGDAGAMAGGALGMAAGGPLGAAAGAYAGRALGSQLDSAGGGGGTLAGDLPPVPRGMSKDDYIAKLSQLTTVKALLSNPMTRDVLLAQIGKVWDDAQALFAFQPAPPPPTQQPTQSASFPGGQVAFGPCAPIVIRFTT